MPGDTYWLQRTRRHLALAGLALVLTTAVFFATPPPDFRHRLSMGTAYASLILLVVSLLLGPWRVLRRRAVPVSFHLRRDVGIWGGIFALVHTGVGLTVHLRGRMWMYFLRRLHPPAIQNTQFGAANYVGAAAALLFVMLLAISNDVSLRRLGTQRWKSIQRWAYVAFGLTVAHGILFQRVEKRHLPWVAFFALLVATALVLQWLGWNRLRQRKPS